jgi:hypothetical protein
VVSDEHAVSSCGAIVRPAPAITALRRNSRRSTVASYVLRSASV